ncbi:lytic transglycosylase domain-containing protein [Salmonella enterica]|nr:lytic transglycosylase domain-containing protein [Salmonella enterica]
MVLPASMLLALFTNCGAGVPTDTLMSITGVESSGNPFVIANVTDNTSYYLASEEEAVRKANDLSKQGKNYSAGLMQVNSKNFKDYGLTPDIAFNYCKNITAGAEILKGCYAKTSTMPDQSTRLKAALSCYYSGNFTRGLVAKGTEKISYVANVVNHADNNESVPSIGILKNDPGVSQGEASSPAVSQDKFFITDTQASEPVQEHQDNDDVVNNFITDNKANEEGITQKGAVNTAATGSWDIFKDYSAKE